MAVADQSKSNVTDSIAEGRWLLVDVRQLLNPANVLTLFGLAAAIACALLAITGQTTYALVALMVSGLCDLFDGLVARMLRRRGEEGGQFGARLDSIVDCCSFGFAPVILMYASGLTGWFEIPLLVLFACCVVWRLAYFDTVGLQGNGQLRYYTGLPTTYVAMYLPLAFLAGFWGPSPLRYCVAAAAAALSFAMISTVPVRKPRGIWYVVFPAAALGLIVVYLVYADLFLP